MICYNLYRCNIIEYMFSILINMNTFFDIYLMIKDKITDSGIFNII